MKFASYYTINKSFVNIGDFFILESKRYIFRYMGLGENDVIELSNLDIGNYSGEPLILCTHVIIDNLPQNIIPCYIGLVIIKNLNFSEISHLKNYEPISCRDYFSYKQCIDNGIDAFLLGCTTKVLPRQERNVKADKVFFVDLPDGAEEYIPKTFKDVAVRLSQVVEYKTKSNIQAIVNKYYNSFLHEAKMVITSRLHCAMFCILHGIPVIMMREYKVSRLFDLEAFISIYDIKRWSEIDFNPQEVYVDDNIKHDTLDCAANLLRTTYYKERLAQFKERLKNFYSKYEEEDYYTIEKHVENIMKNRFPNRNNDFIYSLWGVSLFSKAIYDYITINYKNAVLVNVYDAYREIEFEGHMSKPVEMLKMKNNDEICFVGGGDALKDRLQMINDFGLPKENLIIIDFTGKC